MYIFWIYYRYISPICVQWLVYMFDIGPLFWTVELALWGLLWCKIIAQLLPEILRSKTSTLKLTFSSRTQRIQLFFPHSLNQHVTFNPISLGHNRDLRKLSGSAGKTNCPAKTRIKNDTNDLQTVGAMNTKLFSTVNSYQWLSPDKMAASLLLCEWIAYKTG